MSWEQTTSQKDNSGNNVSVCDREARKADMIRQQKFLVREGATVELTFIAPKIQKSRHWEGFAPGAKAVVTGWFEDPEKLADIALKMDEEAKPAGIYVTLNECNPSVSARSYQHLKAGINRTSKKDIVSLDNLLIDLDPDRPEGISSTNEEHEAALKLARDIKDDLQREGFPEPMFGDSGNGAHLTYKTARPNTPEEVEFRKKVLAVLAQKYSTDKVKVDVAVYDPARITKLYGTVVRKGDNVPDRPHRPAKIISVPDKPEPVPYELLKSIADMAPDASTNQTAKRKPDGADGIKFDLEKYLEDHDIDVKKTKQHGTSTLYVLNECVFNPDHGAGESAIGQTDTGKLFYQCFHDSCQGRTWAEARKIISGDEKMTEFMPMQSKSQPNRDNRKSIVVADGHNKGRVLLPAPPPFPIDAFPSNIQCLLKKVASAFVVPVEIPIGATLALAGSCIGRTRAICIKYGYLQHGNLYIVDVGRSGVGKTPATNAILNHAFKYEEEWTAEYNDEVAAMEAAKEEGESVKDRPRRRQLIVEDTSLEALSDAFAANPRGILLTRDELSGMLLDPDKYNSKNGDMKARLMSAYDSQPWKVNRVMGRNHLIPHATLSLYGSAQPRILSDLFSNRDSATGFLPRFIFLRAVREMPPVCSDDVIDDGIMSSLRKMTRTFLDYNFDDEGNPLVISVSDRAKRRYIEWYNEQATAPWRELDNAVYEALFAKLRGQCLRLCLIIHCMAAFENGVSELQMVTEETMLKAIRITDCLKEHQIQVWQCVVNRTPVDEILPLQRRVVRAILDLQGEIRNGMLPTARIATKVNEGVDEKFHASTMSVGKATGSLGFTTKHLPGETTRGICITPDDINRLKPLIGAGDSVGQCSAEIKSQSDPGHDGQVVKAKTDDSDEDDGKNEDELTYYDIDDLDGFED